MAATAANDDIGTVEPETKKPEPLRTRTGGRIPASAYSADETIFFPFEHDHAGRLCPDGCGGRLYHYGESAVIRITGQGLAKVTQLNLEQLRCNGCGVLKTAAIPKTWMQFPCSPLIKILFLLAF